jgi:hypothetical protein
MGRRSQYGVPGVIRGPCAGRKTATTSTSPKRSISPSQPALARLRLPTCDGRRGSAHGACGTMLLTMIIIPSSYTSVNQGSTDLSVRRGLAGLSVFPLQGVPAPVPPRPSQGLMGRQGRDPGSDADATLTGSAHSRQTSTAHYRTSTSQMRLCMPIWGSVKRALKHEEERLRLFTGLAGQVSAALYPSSSAPAPAPPRAWRQRLEAGCHTKSDK